LMLVLGAAAFSLVSSSTSNYNSTNSGFSFVSSEEIFGGTGFRGSLTPPIDPKNFGYYNTHDHGTAGHGIFGITCYSQGTVDYFPNTSGEVLVYAIADGEVAAVRKTYIGSRGNRGSILELRHGGDPSCSSYAHIDIDERIIQAVKENDLPFGNSTTIIPSNVSIKVVKGQPIGRMFRGRATFTAHLHFQLKGATEDQLRQSMLQLSKEARNN